MVRVGLPGGRRETVADLEAPSDLRAGACTPDGRHLAMASERHVWRLDLVQREELPSLDVGGTCLGYSGDGRWLAVGGRGGVAVFCGEAEVARWPEPAAALAWTPDGRLVWVERERLLVATVGAEGSTLSWPGGKRATIALSPDGRRALLGADHGEWALCDLDAATVIRSGPAGMGPIRSVAWADDGRHGGLGGDKGRIAILEA